MQIEFINRPWTGRTKGHGKRYNPDPFYNSPTWRRTKVAFKRGTTKAPDGKEVPNTLCFDCYNEGKTTLMHTVDHHIPVKDGGSRTDHSNLRALCAHHHAIKSANEGNAKRKNRHNGR